MRLSGFASGLDIDAMVKELMKARRITYDNAIKKRTQVEWKREDYRSVSSKIVDFRNNKLSSFNLSNAINAKASELSGDTNSIKVNSTTSSAAGVMTVKVDQIATAETRVYNFGSSSAATSLESLGFAVDASNTANVALTINGEKISLSKTATLSDLSAAINASSSKVKATALYNASTGQFSIASTETGANKLQLDVPVFDAMKNSRSYTLGSTGAETLDSLGFVADPADATKTSIEVNGMTITMNMTDTLNDLVTRINTDSATLNAEVTYSSGTFKVTSTVTGSNIALEGEPFDSSAVTTEERSVIVEGKQANVSINGVSYEQASNRFAVNGVDFNATAVSSTGAVINVVKDTSKIVETVKSFVQEYNQLISFINGELSEEKYRKYMPLTTEEKEPLKDSEIELWENKAKSGMLRGDTSLTKYVSELRTIATSLVWGAKLADGSYVSAGITTGSYTEKGKLVLDEEKLRNALDSNPDEVVNLFSGSDGVFRKMMDSSMDTLKDLNKIAGTSLTSSETTTSFIAGSLMGEQISGMESKETLMLRRLNMIETQYYKQFTAMETAINKFNSQSSAISSSF